MDNIFSPRVKMKPITYNLMHFSLNFRMFLSAVAALALLVHFIHVPFRISTFSLLTLALSLSCVHTQRRSLLIHEYLSTTKTNLFITLTAKLWLHLDAEQRENDRPRQFQPRTTAMIIFFINNMSDWLSLGRLGRRTFPDNIYTLHEPVRYFINRRGVIRRCQVESKIFLSFSLGRFSLIKGINIKLRPKMFRNKLSLISLKIILFSKLTTLSLQRGTANVSSQQRPNPFPFSQWEISAWNE